MRVTFWISALVLLSTACGCTSFALERNDVQNFKAELRDGSVLHVSGLALHSAYVVDRYQILSGEDELTLLVRMVPAGGGLSGAFQIAVKIPEHVTAVRFGNEGKIIWHREHRGSS